VFDIETVKANAKAQGIVLQQITILYGGLTEDEKNALKELDLLKLESESVVMATFSDCGDALFPEKIEGVHYLAAD